MLRSDAVRLPYPGLRPFEADEADLFFGRERHVDALLKRLSGSHFVAVVGESGSGKSSLVRAGLLPALEAGFVVEAGSDWRVAVMRPGGAPLTALANALLAPGVLSPEGGATHCEFALAELRRGPLGLVQLVRDARLDPHCNTLIVVDQFEELFRYNREPAQKDQANVFVELLIEASQQRQAPIFVVLTMRSDFVGDCARFRGLPELLNDNQYLTPRLTRDQIAAAIREPARVCGGTVDQALIDELCNAVGDNQDQLPLLQHLLMRVWDRAVTQSTPPRLTPELSREMGGLASALNDHAQQIYDSLATDEGRAIGRALFKSLTDPRSERRDLRRDALVSEVAAVAAVSVAAAIDVANEFRATGRHMLMPPPEIPLDATSRLDISHESLLRQWSALAEWAREEGTSAREFDRLRDEAKRERAEQGELLSGRDLARALDWIKQAEPTPAWAERYAPAGELDATLTFVARSEAEVKRRKDEELRVAKREANARRARYYSWISGGALVIAGMVVILILNLWWQAETDRREALRQGGEASRQAKLATENANRANEFSRDMEAQKKVVEEKSVELASKGAEAHTSQLTANARLQIARDPSLAVLLARQAVLEGGSTPGAVGALRAAIAAQVPSVEARLSAAKSTNYIPGSNKESWLDFALSPTSVSPLDDLVITPSGDDAVIWSAASGNTIRTLPGRGGLVGSAGFSPNGRLAVTTSADNVARVWDVATGRVLRTLRHKEGMVNDAVFNAEGTRLITLGDDEVAKIWTLSDEAAAPCELKHSGNFLIASFSQDEHFLATVTHVNRTWHAQVWDVSRGGCPEKPIVLPLLDNMTNLKWASFSSRGGWLGVVTTEGETTVLSVTDWKEQPRFVPEIRYESGDASSSADGPSGFPPPPAWSHDGRYLAVAGGDNTVYIVRIGGSDRPIALRGHTGRVTRLAFSPADDMLLSTSSDSTARIWTLSADKRPLERLVLSGHKDIVGSGVFSPKGDRIVTASDDGTVRSWAPLVALRERLFSGLRAASYSADGRQISVSGTSAPPGSRRADGFWVSVLTATTLAPRGDEIKIRGPSPTFLGPRIIEYPGNAVSLRNLAEPGVARLLTDTDGPRGRLEGPSASGRFVFAQAGFDAIAVWDLNTQARPESVKVPAGQTCTSDAKKKAAWEPQAISDDRSVAWYCAEQDLVVIARPGPSPPVVIRITDKSRVGSMRFSTHGRLVALTFEDYSVRVFDSSNGRPGPVMKGHDGSISGIAFSDDDRLLVSASEDSTARVWDVASGDQVAIAGTNGRPLTGAAFSPDGLSLLLLSPDRLLLWRCYACGDAPGLLEEVRRRRIGRPLSPNEEVTYGLTSLELNAARAEPSKHSHAPHAGDR